MINCYHYHYMKQSIQEWTKVNLWKTAFKKFGGISFKLFKGCLQQILFSLFLNTLSHIFIIITVTHPEAFWAYHYLHNIFSWRDCNVPSSSMIKC